MLPLPDLDDRLFKEMVEDARRLIPRVIPEWTDMNYHDPGITFIDLLAWLIEMQQYHLNRITVASELKYLQLLGLKPLAAGHARACVTFGKTVTDVYLPCGSQLSAGDRIFETEDSLYIHSARLERIISYTEIGMSDYTPFNNSRKLSYFAFGSQAKQHSSLFLGFDQPLASGMPVSLSLHFAADYPAAAERDFSNNSEILPTARIFWKYYGITCSSETSEGTSNIGETEAWLPLDIIKDETQHFYKDGRITFIVPGRMKAAKLGIGSEQPRYLLCAELIAEGYEIPPRIQEISINTVQVIQRETLAATTSFSGSGQPGQRFAASSYSAIYGNNLVQVQDKDGLWHYCRECSDFSIFGEDDWVYLINKDFKAKQLLIEFGNGINGAVLPAGNNNVRLISFMPKITNEGFLGSSNGLPNQRFRLIHSFTVPNSLKIQVGKKSPGSKRMLWEDYQLVDNFDASASGDRHYIFDPETAEIIFGNNENGLIPGIGEGLNIRMIACQVGGGERGNVKEDEINRIIIPGGQLESLELGNHFPAWGGSERETLEDSKFRLYQSMKKSYRAVTSEDFENLALNTPGLRVARAKAIPLYVIDETGHPGKQPEAQVSVVVVPVSHSKIPFPSAGFLETVRRHLDKYRLVCTEVHVIGPEYIKVNVYGVIVVKPGFKLNPQKIESILEKFLQAVDNEQPSQGWVFGRTVYKGD
ncbi:MAG: putative baseplate assembly protein, partial [Syntrophomonadaceae bacterium]|nr:putative baseplate assembly protein [Syntrophomonadaceae bacterium]